MLFSEVQWRSALKKQEAEGLFRTLHQEESEVFLDFTTNDYLHLSQHPVVIEGAMKALRDYGAGRCSSRLIGGGYTLLNTLEKELADWYGKESALLFPSGYQANIAFLSAILSPSSLVIADKYIHRSLIDGIKLSGAKLLRYPHGNIEAMDALLQKHHAHFSHIVCVTESVFSMQGTEIELDSFCTAASRYGALSCVDDAHGFGVMRQDEKTRLALADIVITTLSKGLGVQGGVVLGSKTLIHYLVNFASGFIYTTSLTPALVGGALSALRLLPSLHKERERLWALIERFSKERNRLGLKGSLDAGTHIQPIYIGEAKEACRQQALLRKNQIAVVAIRPPTVPFNQSMLRFSLSTAHSEQSIDLLFRAFQEIPICQ